MWNTLTWWTRLEQHEVARGVEELRREALYILVGAAVTGYATWHFLDSLLANAQGRPAGVILRHWLLFAIIATSAAAVLVLLRRGQPAAVTVFLTTSPRASITLAATCACSPSTARSVRPPVRTGSIWHSDLPSETKARSKGCAPLRPTLSPGTRRISPRPAGSQAAPVAGPSAAA